MKVLFDLIYLATLHSNVDLNIHASFIYFRLVLLMSLRVMFFI